MSLTPSSTSINGRGKPLLIVEQSAAEYTSFGTVSFTATTVTETPAAAVNITSSSASTDRFLNAAVHGLTVGMKVRIAGHTSTPTLNGDYEVTEQNDTTHFSVGVDITVNGSGGTSQRIPDWRNVKVGMRILATKTTSGYARPVWGKITAVNAATWTITVDKWRQGTTEVTPDGSSYTVNGRVIELPYCYELTETFEPDVLVHPLHRTTNLPNRVKTKHFGWFYTCALDYAKHIHADTLIAMRPALNIKETDNIILIPREDKPQHQYNVYHAEAVQLSRFGIGPGHRKPVFVFKGKETLPSWPIPEGGYGFGYADSYGTQL